MTFEIEVLIRSESTIVVTAESEEEAWKIVQGLEVQAEIMFPPESVDDSGFDRFGDLTILGVSKLEEEAA